MTQPRQVVEDRSYMLTRRCSERRFFLRPCKEVEQAFMYCFAVAAQRYQLVAYWIVVMSTHHHDGVRDPLGNYPDFLRYFHSLLARCLNVHLSRWEAFWSTEQSGVVHLGDADAIFDKMIYSLGNPVADHLVDKVCYWPGFSSLRYQLSDKPVVVKRPHWFFDPDGDMPEQAALRFERPPEFAHLSHEQWCDKIRAALAEQERKAAEQRQRTGGKIVGRKAILRRSPYSCPTSCSERRALRPQVATKNKRRRIELLKALEHFRSSYRQAFDRRRGGNTDVLFPFGTFKLRVQGLVCCAPAPAPG